MGLPGEAKKTARVRPSIAAATLSGSSVQPPWPWSIRTERTCAPTSRAMPPAFGQTGSMAIRLSPTSQLSWMASMMAFMPLKVTVIRSGPTGLRPRPVR